jgi:two-component system, OmpR family, response regulator RpaB
LGERRRAILVVDNDIFIYRILEIRFSLMGYKVFTVSDGEQALSTYKREVISLIILNLVLPRINGYSICQGILRSSDIPVILVVEHNTSADKITGFELGIVDYFLKPLPFKELEVKILSVLNIVVSVNHLIEDCFSSCLCINISAIWVDLGKKHVYKKEERIRLTGVEFSLLKLLVNRSGEPFSRSSILQAIWGYRFDTHIDTRIVDVHVSRLRSKLEHDPNNPDLILTSRGVGYVFQKITKILK